MYACTFINFSLKLKFSLFPSSLAIVVLASELASLPAVLELSLLKMSFKSTDHCVVEGCLLEKKFS